MIKVYTKDIDLKNLISKIANNLGVEFCFLDNILSLFSLENSKGKQLIILDGDFLKEGLEKVVAFIKENMNQSYIVYLTTDTSIKTGKSIYSKGIQYYSTKPISEYELNELIYGLLIRNKNNIKTHK